MKHPAQRQYDNACDCCPPYVDPVDAYQAWCSNRSDTDQCEAMVKFLEARGLFDAFEAWDWVNFEART